MTEYVGEKIMRIAVVGMGAIGGPIAVGLALHKIDVVTITKHSSLAKKIQSEGFTLQKENVEVTIKIPSVPLISDLEGKFDIVFFAMKATSVIQAAKDILPFLEVDSVVVTLQNGIVEDDVAKIVGSERIIGAVVATASQVLEPGKVLRSISGSHFIGFLGTRVNKIRLEQVKTFLEYDLPVIIPNNIYEALYSKLVVNAAINGLGALSGLTVGEILKEKHNRQLFLQIITEVVNITNKLQLTLIPIGPIHLPDLALRPNDTNEVVEEKHRKLETSLSMLKDVKSSTLRSLEQGQPSEVDYLNGFIMRKGKELKIPTPINSLITKMIKEIESGSRTITAKNLFELKDFLEK